MIDQNPLASNKHIQSFGLEYEAAIGDALGTAIADFILVAVRLSRWFKGLIGTSAEQKQSI